MKWLRGSMLIALVAMAALCAATGGCGKPSAASPAAVEDKMSEVPATSEPAESPKSDSRADHESVPAEQVNKAATQMPTAPQRVPVDRTPTKPGDAEKITFDDLDLKLPADVVYRPVMLQFNPRVTELEGKRVSIGGYMHGAQLSQRGIKKFVLLKNTQCKFGPGGQADHLAVVILKEGVTTELTPSPIRVEGTLKIEPFKGGDDNTWSIYNLEDAVLKKL